MAGQQGQTQDQANAQVMGQAIDEMAQNFAVMYKQKMQAKMQQKQLDLQSLSKVKDFMSLPPDKRAQLLKDPAFLDDMVRTMDPETFSSKKGTKKAEADEPGMAARRSVITSLGEQTAAEKISAEKATAEADKARSEAQVAELKKNLSTGVTTPTPMNLLGAFDVKDPFAASLFASMATDPQTKELVTNLALAEKKGGPEYQKQQQMDYYKWGMEQGWSPALAMRTAASISQGKWDQVPETWIDGNGKTQPVRSKAETQLAIDTANAVARGNEVQNTIESSIATSSASLAEKSGLSLDQARANVVAMRAGKPTPFATPAMEQHVKDDAVIRGQEVEKNKQTILNDKYGISTIQQSLNGLLAEYKADSGTFFDSTKAGQLKEQIGNLSDELQKRLELRYGVKPVEVKDSWAASIGGAIKSVWDSTKATGQFGADMMKTVDEALGQHTVPGQPSSNRADFELGKFKPTKHTPEQLKTINDLYKQVGDALATEGLPTEKRKQLIDFYNNSLEPAYKDPSKFDLILNPPSLEQ